MSKPSRLGSGNTSNRLKGYVTGTMGIAAATIAADAAIITFADFGDAQNDPDSNPPEIDLPDGTSLLIDPAGGNSFFGMSTGNGSGVYDTAGRFTANGTHNIAGRTYPIPTFLNAGDAITGDGLGTTYPYYPVFHHISNRGDWTVDRDGYIGFVTSAGNEGWLRVTWTASSSRLEWNGGALQTDGSDLTAGAIPEPSVATLTGIFGALIAGRRRRRKPKDS